MEKVSIEDLTCRLSSKSQANFIKLQITIREELKIDKKILPDISILRFFTICKRDVSKTLVEIEKHIKWKKESGVIEHSFKLDIKNYLNGFFERGFKVGYYGVTKKGLPLRILQFADFDYWEVIKNLKREDILAYNVQFSERLLNIIWPIASEKNKKMVDGIITIVDIKNLPVKNIVLNSEIKDILSKNSKVLNMNYPLLTKKSYIINSGVFFSILWTFLQYFLSASTIKRVSILNEDYMGEISKIVDIENLPVCIGGKNPKKIGEYRNIWDNEIDESIKEKRIFMKD